MFSTLSDNLNTQSSGGSRPSDKGGGGHPDPERGGGQSQNFFRLFGSQFGLKIGGGGASPGSATAKCVLALCLSTF